MDTFGLLGCFILVVTPDALTLHQNAGGMQCAGRKTTLTSATASYL